MRFLLLLLLPLSCFAQGFGSFAHDKPFLAAPIIATQSDNPTNISDASIWLISTNVVLSGAAVTSIYDNSGHGNHVTNAAGGGWPWASNSPSSVYWSATYGNRELTNRTLGSLSQPNTIIFVANIRGTAVKATSYNYTLFTTDSDNCAGGYSVDPFRFGGSGSSSNSLFMLSAGTYLHSPNQSIRNITNTFAIYTMLFNGASSLCRTNGVLLMSGNAGNGAINGMFAWSTGNLPYSFEGWLAECIIYNSALSSNNMFTVERYLARKWGITNTVVPGD